MTQALLISNIVLWILVVGLAVIVVALTRQIGLLHERIAPVGALARQQAADVGDTAPALELVDLDGEPVPMAVEGSRTIFFFLSPTCPVCKTLLPTLRQVVADEPAATRVVIASDGDPETHRVFRREHGLEDLPYVLSTALGVGLGVGKLPTAVLLDEHAVVRAHGLVNTREHLESLFEADERGVGSIQELLAQEREVALPTMETGS